MGQKTIRQFCSDCGQPRPFTKSTPDHLIHAIATIFTGGLWLIIWIIATIRKSLHPYRCTHCGKRG